MLFYVVGTGVPAGGARGARAPPVLSGAEKGPRRQKFKKKGGKRKTGKNEKMKKRKKKKKKKEKKKKRKKEKMFKKKVN